MPTGKYTTIICRFVSPGHLNGEIDYIEDDAGNVWMRQFEETEAEFTGRATSETAANAWGIKRLSGQALRNYHVGS